MSYLHLKSIGALQAIGEELKHLPELFTTKALNVTKDVTHY